MNRPPSALDGVTSIHRGLLTTPTARLDALFSTAPDVRIVAKLDNLQLTGSTKERTATFLLAGLIERGELAPGGTVVESTSGNLGTALARQCALTGHQLVAVVDERANRAACQTMRAFGARIVTVATPPDGNRLRARVERVQQLLAEIPGSVTTNQYGNPDNPTAHATTTLPELVDALGSAPDRLYVATSTTGTLLGCQRAIAAADWPTELIAVDAVGSVLFGGTAAERQLPGLGAGFVTELSTQSHPDGVRRIRESDMVLGCRLLARREGILAGASTGALVAAIGADLAAEISSGDRTSAPTVAAPAGHTGPGDAEPFTGRTIAMLVHDGGAPYLPTVYDDEWVRDALGLEGIETALAQPNPFGGPAGGRPSAADHPASPS